MFCLIIFGDQLLSAKNFRVHASKSVKSRVFQVSQTGFATLRTLGADPGSRYTKKGDICDIH